MIMGLLLFAGVVFIAYAIFTQYSHTDIGMSVPKRVWASVGAAFLALGAAISAWFHSGVTP